MVMPQVLSAGASQISIFNFILYYMRSDSLVNQGGGAIIVLNAVLGREGGRYSAFLSLVAVTAVLGRR